MSQLPKMKKVPRASRDRSSRNEICGVSKRATLATSGASGYGRDTFAILRHLRSSVSACVRVYSV